MRCNLVPYKGFFVISDTTTQKTKDSQNKGILRADKGKILIETDQYIIYSSKINNEVYKKKNIL
tara:strand:+ start:194 stop:385 length:192 start_codon:yes stop_codon:yes gene_type:complete